MDKKMSILNLNRLCIILLFAVLVVQVVLGEDRVHDQHLSDKDPGSPEYDHEAFLGKDEAKEFDELSDEESRRRLTIIAKKIDKDENGLITEEELKNWITFTQSRYILEDTEKQFETHDVNKDGKITWSEYAETAYGFSEENDDDDFSKVKTRDKKRFDVADTDSNNEVTIEEFRAFLHPEEHDHMKGIISQETLEEIDKNNDGFLSIDEYIGDMLRSEDGDEEPDWVQTEREHFNKYRDTNSDGKLDLDEVRAWIMPDDYNHAKAEAMHLIYEADDNHDSVLSIEEIINHHDTFVGSQATDWGEGLKRHDEF